MQMLVHAMFVSSGCEKEKVFEAEYLGDMQTFRKVKPSYLHQNTFTSVNVNLPL